MDKTGSLQKAASRSSKDDEDGGERAAHDHNVKSTSSDSGIGYEVIERRGDVARSQSMKSRVRYLVPSFFFLRQSHCLLSDQVFKISPPISVIAHDNYHTLRGRSIGTSR